MNKGTKSKRAQYFARVEKYKERLSDESSDVLRKRLAHGALFKEAAVAIREILEERSKVKSK